MTGENFEIFFFSFLYRRDADRVLKVVKNKHIASGAA